MPFTVHDQYPPPPIVTSPTCWICGADQRDAGPRRERVIEVAGKLVDNHDSIYGGVYICESCIVEAGQLVGMMTARQVDALKAVAAEAIARADQAEARVADYAHVERVLREFHLAELAGVPAAPARAEVPCPEPGCDRTFPHQGALALHRRAHK